MILQKVIAGSRYKAVMPLAAGYLRPGQQTIALARKYATDKQPTPPSFNRYVEPSRDRTVRERRNERQENIQSGGGTAAAAAVGGGIEGSNKSELRESGEWKKKLQQEFSMGNLEGGFKQAVYGAEEGARDNRFGTEFGGFARRTSRGQQTRQRLSGLAINKTHVLHVKSSFNNTLVTLTDLNGNVIANSSGGSVGGFKKAARNGHEAAYQATMRVIEKAAERNVYVVGVELKFNGLGQGREAALKAVQTASEWQIVAFSDATPIPFNGCRAKKRRRL